MKTSIPSRLFKKNRQKLQDLLDDQSLAIFFSNHKAPKNGDQFYPFRQNSDLFYLTGIEEPDTILILTKEDSILFIIEPNELHALWEGTQLTKTEATTISGIEKIVWNSNFQQTLDSELKDKKVVLFNIRGKLASNGLKTKDEEFFHFFKQSYPFHETRSVHREMVELRLIKEPEEIEQIKKGVQITENAFLRILDHLKPGINEKELEAILLYEFIRNRSNGPAYDPIIASGKNACVLHYTQNISTCSDGDLLLMDIGADVSNYASDISRTVPVNGKFSNRQKACYNAVVDVMEKAIKAIKPGITLGALNKQTKEWLVEKHIQLGLYSEKDLEKEDLGRKYFPHGVSHFIGLDVHDYGDKNTVLKEGMVISCEPGLYIPEENIGIRIEDDIKVGNPSVNLSENLPKTIDEIEKIMSDKPDAS